jgi:FKBP-type peptidyl-prolyl cis-trans isomerase FkpA
MPATLSHRLLLTTASLGLFLPAALAAESTQGTAWLNRQMAALAERNGADGWHVTPSGLRWRRIAGNGSGTRPGPTDRVIPGWQEGVALMGVGDKVELAIPYQLAYGAEGKGPIPGAATLLFTVELLGIEPAG